MVYLKLLTLELSPDSDPLSLRAASPPLSAYRERLHAASVGGGNDDGAAAPPLLNDVIRERSYEMLDRVSAGRNGRIAALQNTFPPLHYVTITALTAAILFVFLIETDRPVILFLDNFQLRLIWALLVGTLTAIYCIGIDLSSPFVGTYVVAADQLLDEAEDLLTLIRETSVDKVPQSAAAAAAPPTVPPPRDDGGVVVEDGGGMGVPYPTSTQGMVEANPPSAAAAASVEAPQTSTVPAAFSGDAAPATGNEDLDQPLEQATSYEEYMRRRQQGEY